LRQHPAATRSVALRAVTCKPDRHGGIDAWLKAGLPRHRIGDAGAAASPQLGAGHPLER